MDGARRPAERRLLAADAAEELAKAAETVLAAADAGQVDQARLGLGALRSALDRYRAVAHPRRVAPLPAWYQFGS